METVLTIAPRPNIFERQKTPKFKGHRLFINDKSTSLNVSKSKS